MARRRGVIDVSRAERDSIKGLLTIPGFAREPTTPTCSSISRGELIQGRLDPFRPLAYFPRNDKVHPVALPPPADTVFRSLATILVAFPRTGEVVSVQTYGGDLGDIKTMIQGLLQVVRGTEV